MKLKYDVTGNERKSLAGAVSTVLDAPTKYLGAPTFAYEIDDYHIDKNGALTGPDNLDLEDALHQMGFDADGDSREYYEKDTYESGLGGMGALDEFPDIYQHHPGRYVNPDAPITEAMQRQLDEAHAFEDLRMDGREELGLGRTRRENYQGESGMQASDVPGPYDDIGLVIEMPRSSFTDAAIENLKRLVESKGSLIKKALRADSLSITVGDDKISFPWFEHYPAPEEISAYTEFISRLCVMAKTLKRVTAQDKDVENEKYAFRCFLLRLGFIGDEHNIARKFLMKNLSGSSAFKNGSKKEFSQKGIDKMEHDPGTCAEISAILNGEDSE